jgi:2'-5' RNA ligase
MENIEKNVAEEAKKGRMVAFFVPIDVGRKVQDLFRDYSGDEVKPEDMHITLGLVRSEKTNLINSVLKDVCQSIDPFDVTISSFGKFEPHKSNDFKYVLYAKPESDKFKEIHDHIFSTFEKHGIGIDNGDFEFKPHITIKYCSKEPDVNRSKNFNFKLDQVSLCVNNEKFPHNLRGV